MGQGIFSVTAIDLVPGKTRLITQVFFTTLTVAAFAAVIPQPWYSQARSMLQRYARSALYNTANNFVTRHDGKPRIRKLSSTWLGHSEM